MENRVNKCIDSALNQNFESYEVIIVNDVQQIIVVKYAMNIKERMIE